MDFSRFDPNTRRIAEQLAEEPLVSVTVLADELRQYVDGLQMKSADAEFVDYDVARRIAGLCAKLLDALPEKPDTW